ncbi:DBI [Symbiodinium sp. KB8]|nr:DBI [Symbiodinium sp. KB8]
MCGRLEWPVTFPAVGQPPLQRAHKITTPKTHSLTASAPTPPSPPHTLQSPWLLYGSCCLAPTTRGVSLRSPLLRPQADLDAQFQAAADSVKSFEPKTPLTNAEKLDAYKYYKQATVGDVNTAKPGMFDLTGQAKWDAWNSVKGTSTEDAKKAYIEVVKKQQEEHS